MKASTFIAGKLKFKGRLAVASITVSFLVMLIAISVTSGFRTQIRKGLSEIFGDIQISADGSGFLSDTASISTAAPWYDRICSLPSVQKVTPVVYKAGIIKKGDAIEGIIFKGIPDGPDSLGARIPSELAAKLGFGVGDRMTAYLAGQKVRVRNFTIREIYDAMVGGEDKLVVYCSLKDMQDVCGLGPDDVSAVEVNLKGKNVRPEALAEATSEIGSLVYACSQSGQMPPVASSSVSRFPQVFSWLDLLDVNVLLVLALMIAVAGFNMISGLLIVLFRNISAIGTLKSMGMRDWPIASAFLQMASKVVLKGLVIGNLLGLGFCLVQGSTHLIKLNPQNYFVSYVPVSVDVVSLLITNVAAYAVIMLMLLLPSLFISSVDPSKTVKVR